MGSPVLIRRNPEAMASASAEAVGRRRGAGVRSDPHDRLWHVAPADPDTAGQRLLGAQAIGRPGQDQRPVGCQRALGLRRVAAHRHDHGVGGEGREGGVVAGQQGHGPVGVRQAGGQEQPFALGEQLLPAGRDLVSSRVPSGWPATNSNGAVVDVASPAGAGTVTPGTVATVVVSAPATTRSGRSEVRSTKGMADRAATAARPAQRSLDRYHPSNDSARSPCRPPPLRKSRALRNA